MDDVMLWIRGQLGRIWHLLSRYSCPSHQCSWAHHSPSWPISRVNTCRPRVNVPVGRGVITAEVTDKDEETVPASQGLTLSLSCLSLSVLLILWLWFWYFWEEMLFLNHSAGFSLVVSTREHFFLFVFKGRPCYVIIKVLYVMSKCK